ncbi:MAG: insulinase family protein [Holosporaceae bacterium]|nr:insulinase family protein [Holosporaceae bacterium]
MNRKSCVFRIIFFLFTTIAGAAYPLSDSAGADIKELRSNCGVNFWFMRDGSAPLVHVRIVFKKAGASCLEKTKAGLPVFYSEAVFCGCGKYSQIQFEKECANLSAKISCNADFDNFYFSLTVPKIVLKEAIVLMNSLLSSPNFEEDKVKIVRNNLKNSFMRCDLNPIGAAVDSIIPAAIFKNHPYESGLKGSSEDFPKLSTEDLKNYKSEFLVTANAEACVFGDISESEAVSLIDKIFSDVKNGKPSANNIADVTPNLNSEIKKYYAPGPQSIIIFVLKNERPQSAKRGAAEIIYKILGEGTVFKGRILSKLRMGKGLIYSGSVCLTDRNHSSCVLGYMRTDNSKVPEAVSSLKEIIKNLREKGISESELQFAKDNIKGKISVRLRTSEKLCDFYFEKKLQGFGPKVLSDIFERINRVTPEEVNSFAGEFLNENEMFFVITGGENK